MIRTSAVQSHSTFTTHGALGSASKIATPIMAALCLSVLLASNVHAQIVVKNWQLTPTSLSFDITGSNTVNFTPSLERPSLFIGQPGNNNWILSPTNSMATITGTADGIGFNNAGVVNHPVFGNYAYTVATQPIPGEFTPLEFNDGIDDSINLTFSVTGQFDPSAIRASNVIVSWGLNSSNILPDPDTPSSAPPSPTEQHRSTGIGGHAPVVRPPLIAERLQLCPTGSTRKTLPPIRAIRPLGPIPPSNASHRLDE